MVEAVETAAKVLADVAAEKRRCSEAPVLGDVLELVCEKSERVRGRILHARRRRPRKEDAPPEDDRARPRERSQEVGQTAAVKTSSEELGGKPRAELLGEDRGNALAGHYEPARVLRSDAICFSSTSYPIWPERTSSFQESTGPPFAWAGRKAHEDIARRR